jgi:2-C-methyl-D-erythritol 4-phosphate cytidylyltransferase/2-C-methyl-D-erythritol 2,4-cyclodiphosphate synthase
MAMEHGITALIVAAGQGNRAGLGIAKQYRDVDGKTVLAHAIPR